MVPVRGLWSVSCIVLLKLIFQGQNAQCVSCREDFGQWTVQFADQVPQGARYRDQDAPHEATGSDLVTTRTPELQEILSTLDSLKERVEVLSSAEVSPSTAPPEPDSSQLPGAEAPTRTLSRDGLEAVHLDRLCKSMRILDTLQNQRDFPEFFSRFARQSGLRLLLLKRWTSGLQVYLEVGVKLPPEARRKRTDGRAPIPMAKGDVFEVTSEETAVYAGPVPVRNFPLDLTLMLGRGARDRRIVILPLPSKGHWNTFIYMDGDKKTQQAMHVVEILAQYALGRMFLVEKGVVLRQGRVDSILKSELARRAEKGPRQEPEINRVVPTAPEQESPAEETVRAEVRRDLPEEPEVNPFGEAPSAQGPASDPTAVTEKREPVPVEWPSLPEPDMDGAGKLTPEDILHHSGELPALPKAACHIMAVIEDPRTTATRLEKALAMDQTLTAKVLRIANSPFYGAVREIKTVSESIVRLGFVAIRNWTLVTAARSVFLAPGAGALYRKIWQQSVLSAMAGQLVAQAAGVRDPESVFIGGLMQNIGQLVLARSYPEMFQEILLESTSSGQPYHVIERQILGFDHGELGALLIREWNLSRDLEEAVRWHHRFDDPSAHNARLAAMISLGEEIAWCSGAAREGAAVSGEPSAAAQFLGLSAEKVAELERRAAELKIDPHFFN